MRADAVDRVSEEAEEARKDLIDVAGKTVPADELVRGEVTASKRRPEDTECAFIMPLLLEGTYCVQSIDRCSSHCPTQTELSSE